MPSRCVGRAGGQGDFDDTPIPSQARPRGRPRAVVALVGVRVLLRLRPRAEHALRGRTVGPAGNQRARTGCTTSNALPILDTVVAVPLIGAGVLAIVAGASQGSCSGEFCVHLSSGEAIAIGAVVIGVGALALSSAVTGYGRTADCRRSEEALPGDPHPNARHLLDLNGISEARARSE